MKKNNKADKFIHQELIDQCRQGNRRAQFKIYKLYYKAMYNTSLRILNNRFEAEDVMQEAFLKAFKYIDQYKAEVSFGAWLKRIVINKSIDQLRKRKGLEEPLTTTDKETLFENEDQDEENFEKDVDLIKNQIYRLPEGYRVVLTLYLLEGYDHEEIGQILNISPSTSRSQYTRAKERLLLNLKKKEK